jgi:catechol 2,3-dioxygenase-like lactoylglutathione lyase family enzyme
MELNLDHVVLWSADPLRTLSFYEQVVGLAGERVAEFRDGKVPFPSVRIGPRALLDLMPLRMAEGMNGMSIGTGSAGHPINHICLSMSQQDFTALRRRVEEHGGETVGMRNSFGAEGHAPETFYFRDPDGNVLEARYYA